MKTAEGLVIYALYRYGGRLEYGMLLDEASTVLANAADRDKKMARALGVPNGLALRVITEGRARTAVADAITSLVEEDFIRVRKNEKGEVEVFLTEKGKEMVREDMESFFSEERKLVEESGMKTYLLYVPRVRKRTIMGHLRRLGLRAKATVLDEYLVFETDRSYDEVKKAFSSFPFVKVFLNSGDDRIRTLFAPPKRKFSEGDLVRVKDGEYRGFTGRIAREMKEKYLVHLVVFGRLVPVEVPGENLEPVAPGSEWS